MVLTSSSKNVLASNPWNTQRYDMSCWLCTVGVTKLSASRLSTGSRKCMHETAALSASTMLAAVVLAAVGTMHSASEQCLCLKTLYVMVQFAVPVRWSIQQWHAFFCVEHAAVQLVHLAVPVRCSTTSNQHTFTACLSQQAQSLADNAMSNTDLDARCYLQLVELRHSHPWSRR